MPKGKRDAPPQSHSDQLLFYVKLAAALVVVCISAMIAAYVRRRTLERSSLWAPPQQASCTGPKIPPKRYAYAMQATSDDTILAVLTSVFSLKCSKSEYPVICQYRDLNENNVRLLHYVCDDAIPIDTFATDRFDSQLGVERLQIPEGLPNAPVTIPEFDRLRSWQLTQFEKVVHLDMHALILHNIDELFAMPGFAAARDHRGVCPLLDPAVMVIEPNEKIFAELALRLRTADKAVNRGLRTFHGKEPCAMHAVWQNHTYLATHLFDRFYNENFWLPSHYNVKLKFAYAGLVQQQRDVGLSLKVLNFGNAPVPWLNMAAQHDKKAMAVADEAFYSHMACVWLRFGAAARIYVKRALEVPAGKPGATVNTPSNKELLKGLCPSASLVERVFSSPRACAREPQVLAPEIVPAYSLGDANPNGNHPNGNAETDNGINYKFD